MSFELENGSVDNLRLQIKDAGGHRIGDRMSCVLEAQVENVLLKVEPHKWQSKAAAAEAVEERSKREIFALNCAL
nr:RB1-inducible coiled-coil protein 1-like isoform X1 [Ipomoea batatas]GMD78381.1 RB1-inducible coiled-coil protein 1-like isoform X1 [Ipomoea batatas]